MKTPLTSLPNIGKVLEERLKEVGIEAAEDLKSVGSENAFIRLQTVDNTACVNEILALEGAIQGVRWHNLDDSSKERLKMFYQQTQLDIARRRK